MLPAPPTTRLLADFTAAGLLPPAQATAVAEAEQRRPFSLHYELRALLYLGVTLLAGGLGVLIYENRDSLGHSFITGLIVVAMLASFWYAARHRPAFTWGEAPRTSIAADYLLLLGCLLFLVLEGYVQVQYGVFGSRYGLAALLPALVFFPLAYRYDHRGVLGLGIAALGAWLSVSVAPLAVLQGTFDTDQLAGPALGLGVALVAAGLASEHWQRKPHFAYTYLLTGGNLALLAATRLFFEQEGPLSAIWWLLVLALSAGLVWYARRTQSYLFLLLGVAYAYVIITVGVGRVAFMAGINDFTFYLGLLYFPLTLVGVVLLMVNGKKILRIV